MRYEMTPARRFTTVFLASVLLFASPLPCAEPEAANPPEENAVPESPADGITETDAGREREPSDGPLPENPASVPPIRLRLVESARALLGAPELVVNGRRYSYDCSGTVMAIYASAGIDLFPEYAKYGGNGVNRIYRIMETADLLYDTKRPVPGDVVFWDDTYDRNGDGLTNDPLTHTGMVISITDAGLISYVHFHYAKGVIVEYMSLEDPETHLATVDGKQVNINSPLRMKSARKGGQEGWLAGQLYRAFGKGYLFERDDG